MIVAIGVDIVDVGRLERHLNQFGESFAARVIDAEEFESLKNDCHPASFLARRLAAKEAFAKALGTGFSQGMSRREVTVCHDEKGAPCFRITGTALRLLSKRRIVRTHLSISDEKALAVAFVVFED